MWLSVLLNSDEITCLLRCCAEPTETGAALYLLRAERTVSLYYAAANQRAKKQTRHQASHFIGKSVRLQDLLQR